MASSAIDQEKGSAGVTSDVYQRAGSDEAPHKFETAHDAAAHGHAATDA
jgi:hypothetical protein